MAVFNTYIMGVTLGVVVCLYCPPNETEARTNTRNQLPIWAVVVAIYRYYFQPLRNYPGPITNAISGLPTVVNLISGRQHAYIKRLHDRPGKGSSTNLPGFAGSETVTSRTDKIRPRRQGRTQ
jgi:hypothetical protein